MRQKYRFAMIACILVMALTPTMVYAQSDSPAINPEQAIAAGLALSAFLVGGIEWAVGGYLKAWREHRNKVANSPGTADPDWKGFQFGKMKDDVLIGLFTGMFVFLLTSIAEVPKITDLMTFVAAVQFAVGIIAPFDKYFVGTILNK